MLRNAPLLLSCPARLLALLAVSLLIAACAGRNDAARPAANNTAVTGTVPEQAADPRQAANAPDGDTGRDSTATDDPDNPFDNPLPPETSLEETAAQIDDPCKADEPSKGVLDKTQSTVYWTVCGATRWFDGFFGDRTRYDSTVRESNGRVGLGTFYDQREGWDIDYRFRGQLALPAAEDKLREWQGKLKLGRGTDRELIEDRGVDDGDTLPGRFDQVEDASWLLGVGFQRGQKLDRGFDLDFGVRFRVPPDPFVKGRWYRNWDYNEDTLLRFRQTVFWTNERGFGTTSQVDIDKLISQNLLTRWSNSGTVAEDREGLDWTTALSFFQGLSNRRAFNYRLFMRGETGRRASLQNFGVDIGYRQRILREWLFAEIRTTATFPRFTILEERKLTLGIGLFFDMYFGPVPDEEVR